MPYTPDEIEKLRQLAEIGHCPACGQTVAFNTYGVSVTMTETLKSMAKITDDQLRNGGNRNIDVRVSGLDHNHRSTLSKLRQHGLIAKVKEGKKQVAGHWVVTVKGWGYLSGQSIPEKVEVYNNTVLGHVGGNTDVHTVLRGNKAANHADLIETEKVGTGEARALGSVRDSKPRETTKHRARYLLNDYRGLGLTMTGQVFDIEVERLVMGKPVVVIKPQHQEFKDISAFRRAWEILQ